LSANLMIGTKDEVRIFESKTARLVFKIIVI
jgi:hypothetical protein